MTLGDPQREASIEEIENWNLDRTVDPLTKVTGIMGKNSGTWNYLRADSSGQLAVSSGDAGNFRVSALGVTVNTSPLSADSSSVSAKQQDANNLHVSAFSNDAGLMRVSALGVSVTSTPLSADSSAISAKSNDAGTMRVSAINSISALSPDAALFRVSGIGTFTVNTQPTVSAFINQGTVSAYSPDASLFRVSGIGTFTTTGLSANQQISALLLGGTANIGFVSARSDDAGLTRISAVGTITVSAHEVKQSDAASMRVSVVGTVSTDDSYISSFIDNGSVSAKSPDANQIHVSSTQSDAGLLHASAYVPMYSWKHVSSTQIITLKSAAGYFDRIVINDGNAKTINIYAGSATTSDKIAVMDAPTKGVYPYQISSAGGLTISTISSHSYTAVWL